MTPKEFKDKMEVISEIPNTDERHESGDNLMSDVLDELGYADGVDIFWDMDKWYA